DDWNWGLEGACKGGNIDIVKLMIKKGAYDWDSGLYGACEGRHMNIVELMIKKGANYNYVRIYYDRCFNCDWN
ncbi:MAG: hypothetical protein ACE5RH_01995, partial [Nitrosarchaeum sp.]